MEFKHIKTNRNILENLGIKSYSLCICGSGKKYRNCCEIKSNEPYLTSIQEKKHEKLFGKSKKFLAASNGFLMEAISEKSCLSLGCKNKSCHSHTIPKNKMSKYFASKHGFMYQITDETIWENRTISINKATVFYGRCNNHDSKLFCQTDKKEFKDDDNTNRIQELCLKLMGRSYRLKHNELKNIYSVIKTRGINEQSRYMWHAYYESYILRRKIYIDLYQKHIKGRKALNHHIFKIKKEGTIFLSNCFYINTDFDGKYLKPNYDLGNIFLNIFPEGPNTYIIFSVQNKEDSNTKDFFNKINRIYRNDTKTFKLIINNIILYYNIYSVITENKVIEKEKINYKDFSEQYPDYKKYKLLDENRVIFIK